MLLYLIRHGETAWNRDQIFRGRYDVPLSDRGLLQAAALPSAFSRAALEAIYSSPLSRAQQTAAPLGQARGTAVETIEAFTDMDYGDWTALPEAEAKGRYPGLFAQWETSPEAVCFPNGESLLDVTARADRAARDVAARHECSAAIVSHRVTLKMIVLALLGLGPQDFWRVRLDTCSITAFEMSAARTTLVRLNDTSHLAELRAAAAADF